MTSERRAACIAGASLGLILVFVDAMVLRLVGSFAAGVLLIRLWTPASGKAIPLTEGSRMGIITGLIVGITRQFLLLVLVIIGVFIDPAPAFMQPPDDAVLYAFEQEWGINYYTFNILLDVFGGCVAAGLGAALGIRLYESDESP
ncbi:MAG: hypothetical protein R6U20_13290 [Longimonas sp.]|uniref:hypothetical protein n=1 Tax=Longimonas sp. TaxID=2039626 RepID=UPI0039766F0B